MNLVIQTGRLSSDPKIGTSQGGAKYATFSVAVERKYSNGDKKEVDYHDCVAFNRKNGSQVADLVEKFLKKGKPITVIGSLQYRSYTPQGSDKKVTRAEIIVDAIEFLPTSNSRGQSEQAETPEAQPAAAAAAPAPGAGDEEVDPWDQIK